MAGAAPANASSNSKSKFDFDIGGNSSYNSAASSGAGPPGDGDGDGNGRRLVRSLVIKAACLLGGAYLLKRLTKTTTRWDHSRIVAQSLCGEKFSTEQAARDPMTYFNLRMTTCPATVLADGARVLYFEQRFYTVKPCPKDMKCDVEVASHAVRDIEQYRNFCDRPKNECPQQMEIVKDKAEHLTTVYLSKCGRGRRCLYEGSTPPDGFPNSWNGASRCTTELTVYKTGEIHSWDRAYDDEGNQVWGVRQGPYEFKPGNSNTSGALTESDFIRPLQQKRDTLSISSS